MADDDAGFLARWSRRKSQLREGRPVADGPAARAAPPSQAPAAPAPQADPPSPQRPVAVAEGAAATGNVPPAPTPAPTLADVERLGAESDYSSFVAPHVDPQVRNAAMKKLFFSDPHFNVMDGLDTYIDDYSRPDPLPRAWLRQLAHARTLGLLDDELEDQDPASRPEGSGGARADPRTDTPPHEDADLQLQRHDAAGRPGPGAGDGGGGAGLDRDPDRDPGDGPAG